MRRIAVPVCKFIKPCMLVGCHPSPVTPTGIRTILDKFKHIPQPIATIRRCMHAKAIIASDIPGIQEVVEDGKEALLFDPKDVHMLEQAFLRLYHDQEFSQSLGNNAKRKVQLYNTDAVLDKILEIYQKSIS